MYHALYRSNTDLYCRPWWAPWWPIEPCYQSNYAIAHRVLFKSVHLILQHTKPCFRAGEFTNVKIYVAFRLTGGVRSVMITYEEEPPEGASQQVSTIELSLFRRGRGSHTIWCVYKATPYRSFIYIYISCVKENIRLSLKNPFWHESNNKFCPPQFDYVTCMGFLPDT